MEDADLDLDGAEMPLDLDGAIRALHSRVDECAMSALRRLARDPANTIAIREAGIPPLVAMMESGSAVAKKNAARALRDLVNINDEFKAMIREAGGIPPLLALLSSPGFDAKGSAMEMLYNLAHNSEETKAAIREAGGIPVLVAVLRGPSFFTGEDYASKLLWNLSLNDAGSKVAVREAGGIPPLLALVESGKPMAPAREAATRALLALARNNDDNAVEIALARGRGGALMELARRGSVTVRIRIQDDPDRVFIRRLDRVAPVQVIHLTFIVVWKAGAAARRKAALVVAALLRDCCKFAGRVPRYIKPIIESYL